MTQLKTRRWQEMLTPEQQEKYANAIRQGYFATYDGYPWRHTFYGAWIWKHPGRVKVVNIFKGIVGRPPMWEDLTDDNLRDFREEIASSYAPNSAKTIFAEVNAIIRENSSKPVPSLNFGTVLRTKKVPSQSVALTDEEIRRIHEFTPRTRAAKHAKRIFMLECLCGARLSDCLTLSPDNISEDGRIITYVSHKTKTVVKVPIHPWLRIYLQRTSPTEPREISVRCYNDNIRDICRACGIDTITKVFRAGRTQRGHKWEFVSSHTGRRSFATNLALKGIPIEQIALCMGHMSGNVPNISMTQRYIVGEIGLSPETFAAFQIPGAERAEREMNALHAVGKDYPEDQ